MHRRGETELHAATLARALRVLDGERRAARGHGAARAPTVDAPAPPVRTPRPSAIGVRAGAETDQTAYRLLA